MARECPFCENINDDDDAVCQWCDYDDDINEGWIGETTETKGED